LEVEMTDPNMFAVRIRLVDGSGHPVAGVQVRVSTIGADAQGGRPALPGRADPPPGVPLATLQTDATGYCSAKFDRTALAGASAVSLDFGAANKARRVLTMAQLNQDTLQTITVTPSDETLVLPQIGLPAVSHADLKDWYFSPGSVGTIPQQTPDGGICKQLTPTNLRVRTFPAYAVHADICRLQMALCPVGVEYTLGTILEYEISWQPLGTALGDLLNTITLAPCEQVNVAVIDWMRQEASSLSSASDVQQALQQTMNRDRLITDTMASTVKTMSRSTSMGGTIGAAYSGVALSFGGALSNMQELQDASVNTADKLSETIKQSASFVSSQRSTVVFQANASEQLTYQTRAVRNNNHCHTLTLAYYEVNESYTVTTTYKGSRSVVLIKYDNAEFSAARAFANAEILKPALLDRSLLGGFDALAEALFCCTTAIRGSDRALTSITIKVWLPPGAQVLYGEIHFTPASWPSMSAPLGFSGSDGVSHAGGWIEWTVAVPGPGLDPVDAAAAVLMFMGTAQVSRIEIDGYISGANTSIVLYSATNVPVPGGGPNKLVNLSLPLHPGEAAHDQPESTACTDRSCAVQKLLGHLNSHKRFYNSLLWMNEDPNERVMRWSCCEQDGEQFSLVGMIENNPLTIYGDFLVFPAAGSVLSDVPSTTPAQQLITLPTPGVFSEGILGQCNTCEIVDNDRFWDWKSSPCPDNAPTITPTLSPQPGSPASSLKPDAVANLIALTAVPDAGQNVLKDLISALVSKADQGSSEASALLGNLLESVKSSLKGSDGG
jgi:hypothetical protein